MALSNRQVFNNQTRTSAAELLAQQVDKFNAASGGAITLRTQFSPGDYAEEALISYTSGLVRRRDPYTTSSPSKVVISEVLKTSVKIAAGTPPVELDPTIAKWIGENPTRAGIAVGEQLAKDSLADMLNTALGACKAALVQDANNYYDYSGTGTLNWTAMNTGSALMGDAFDNVACVIMHSKCYFDLMAANISNTGYLFDFGTVRVRTDTLGRPLIVTDSSSLTSSGPTRYYTLGLVPGAISVQDNGDYDQVIVDGTGGENITRTMQAEWSWNLGLKGMTWVKSTGGKAPTTAEVTTGTNWSKIATDAKDLPGFVVKSQ
jgi:hypothetical protein